MATPTPPTKTELENHPVVSPDEWLAARKQLLSEEKQLLLQLDAISAKRRALPWVAVQENYRFEGPEGPTTLADLFRGRSQLIIYHFMFGPGWKQGCDGCSFLSDHVDSARQHFEHNDVAFAAVSRAPLAELLPFKKRMGWTFPWVSSQQSNFNYDFHTSTPPGAKKILYNFEEIDAEDAGEEHHGLSVFYKKSDGSIYRTYSTYARGVDILASTLQFLDLVPKGRNEISTMNWVRLHDQYEENESGGSRGCSA